VDASVDKKWELRVCPDQVFCALLVSRRSPETCNGFVRGCDIQRYRCIDGIHAEGMNGVFVIVFYTVLLQPAVNHLARDPAHQQNHTCLYSVYH